MAVTDADHAGINDPAGSAWRVLDALDEGIYTIDPDGSCTFVNQAALRSLGYGRAGDLLGHNMHDVIHHTKPDGAAYPRAECPLLQTAHGGHPVRLANETLWRRDGTPFLAEYSAYPIIEDGRPAGSVITFREEFVREDARTRLAVQYAVSQVLTGSAGLATMIDRVLETIGTGFQWEAGRYWTGGAALELVADWRRTGAAGTEAPGTEAASPGPAARCWATRRAVQESSREGTLAAEAFRSGFAFPVGVGETASGVMEFFSRRIIPADPSLLGALEVLGQMVGQGLDRFRIASALRDSERRFRVIAGEAEAANLAKSLFLANMSHELRTPLSAIIGYSEMLIEDAQEPEIVRDIRKIETNARHLLGLINDVLDLSKVESGKMEAFPETFDVASVVTEIVATAQTLAQKNGNTLSVHLAGDLGSMHSDVTRLRQMLLNLLSNAAKFTTGGQISLSAAREAGPDGIDRIRFAVADTGLGMTAEQLANLFQRFQQADASTTRRFGGTGLGLSLTRFFSQLLGGQVTVSSVPGQGSIFTILLPATLPADGHCDR